MEKSSAYSNTLKSAGKNLGMLATYFGALIVPIVAFNKIGPILKPAIGTDHPAVVVTVAAIPALCVFFFSFLPSHRRKSREKRLAELKLQTLNRPDYFRITPYDDHPEDHSVYMHPKGTDKFMISMLQRTDQDLIYLTGRSGCGKTSLLQASLLPTLRSSEPKFKTLIVRGFADPLDDLVECLNKPGFIWSRPPSIDLNASDLIEKASKYLKSNRLLIVFDQFEEFLILHESGGENFKRFETFISEVFRHQNPSVKLMIVLRSDYIGMLNEIEIPRMRQGKNWIEMTPFNLNEATVFIEKSGLSLNRDVALSLVKEAEGIEKTSGLIRPIILNIIGLVLSNLEKIPNNVRADKIIINYLKASLEQTNFSDYAMPLLRLMVNEYGTKRPRSTTDLASSLNWSKAQVQGCLLLLGNKGVVRNLDQKQVMWEISHDFIVPILVQIVGRQEKKKIYGSQVWIGPLSLIMWLASFGVGYFFNDLTKPKAPIPNVQISEMFQSGVATRGVASVEPVLFEKDVQTIVLIFNLPNYWDYMNFKVSIIDSNENSLWEGDVALNEKNSFTLALNRDFLLPTEHELVAWGMEGEKLRYKLPLVYE